MPERLPVADRALYGLGSLGNASLFWAMTAWLIYFYAPPAESGLAPLMPIAVVGLVLFAGRFIEAFDDPLIGWWSDRSRTRWGRRIPFLLVGTPILAITFVLLWQPPLETESLLNALYFFVMLELFFLANTIVQAPYEALQAELAETSRDRVSMGAWKVFFGAIGAALAFVASGPIIEAVGFAGMALTLAVVATAALYGMLFGLWGRGTLRRADAAAAASAVSIPLIPAMRATLTHRPFLALAASYVLFSIGYSLLVQMLPFYVTVVIGAPESQVSLYTAGVIGIIVLMLPVLSWLASRVGKRAVYLVAMLGLGLYLPFLGFGAFEPLAPGLQLLPQSVALIWLTGTGFAALFVFPGALMADVVDDDFRRSGSYRAAVYYGMLKTLEKFAFAAAAGIFGVLLQVFGYTAAEPLGLRLVLPIAGACVLGAFIAFAAWYRLRDEAARLRSPLAV